MSSINSKWERNKEVPIFMSLQDTLPFASRIALIKPSMTIKNNKGDKGHPCLSPLQVMKIPKVDPRINTTKDTDDTQLKTQFTKGAQKLR